MVIKRDGQMSGSFATCVDHGAKVNRFPSETPAAVLSHKSKQREYRPAEPSTSQPHAREPIKVHVLTGLGFFLLAPKLPTLHRLEE